MSLYLKSLSNNPIKFNIFFLKILPQVHACRKLIYLRKVNLVKTKKNSLTIDSLLGLNYNKNFNVSNNNFNKFVYWFYFHQNFFYYNLFKKATSLRHINSRDVIPSSLIPYIVFSSKTINWRRHKIIHSNEIIELLFVSLWLKNLNLFMKWLQKFFESRDLKKHRKVVILLGILLGKFAWGFNIFTKLKGLRVSIIGKFGKAGSVRKSRKYIKRGKCSFTSKKIAMVTQTKIIRTITGVFSVKLELFY